MDIELLRTFLEICKTNHFGKAADNLYLTQAAVSSRIKQLEELLSVPLFYRNRSNTHLTAEGQRLVEHAESILNAWALAKQDIALSSNQQPQISLGSSQEIWDIYLRKRLLLYKKNNPDTIVRIELHAPEKLKALLTQHHLDVAAFYNPPSNPDELLIYNAGQFDVRLTCTEPGLSLEQALSLGYIRVNWGTRFSIFHSKNLPHHLIPTLYTSNSKLAFEYMLNASGSAFLADPMTADQLKETLYHVNQVPCFSKNLHLATLKCSRKQQVLEAFVSELIKQPI